MKKCLIFTFYFHSFSPRTSDSKAVISNFWITTHRVIWPTRKQVLSSMSSVILNSVVRTIFSFVHYPKRFLTSSFIYIIIHHPNDNFYTVFNQLSHIQTLSSLIFSPWNVELRPCPPRFRHVVCGRHHLHLVSISQFTYDGVITFPGSFNDEVLAFLWRGRFNDGWKRNPPDPVFWWIFVTPWDFINFIRWIE